MSAPSLSPEFILPPDDKETLKLCHEFARLSLYQQQQQTQQQARQQVTPAPERAQDQEHPQHHHTPHPTSTPHQRQQQPPTPSPTPPNHPTPENPVRYFPWLTSNIIDSSAHLNSATMPLSRREQYHMSLLAIHTSPAFADTATMDALKELSAAFYAEVGVEGRVCCVWTREERGRVGQLVARGIGGGGDVEELEELEGLYRRKGEEYTEVDPFTGDVRGLSGRG